MFLASATTGIILHAFECNRFDRGIAALMLVGMLGGILGGAYESRRMTYFRSKMTDEELGPYYAAKRKYPG